MSTEHSTLPWHIRNGAFIYSADNEFVAEGVTGINSIANASLIVTAVNSHAPLLAAAKEALANMNDGRPDFHPSIRGVLEAAIARAEESAP